jgi:uncharacterized circularly permuted ATP-grasp superfamily protein
MSEHVSFDDYVPGGFHDEYFFADGKPRPEVQLLIDRINQLPPGELVRRHESAERALLQMGITFTVYGDEAGTERIFPFDIVPRIIEAQEWERLERGLAQRVRALNLFIDDVYHEQKIVKDGVIPASVIESSQGYRKQCMGLDPPGGVWCHITGTDLVRDGDGTVYVLEDNLRCPSGVSYVLENREVMKQSFPRVFDGLAIRPVGDYPGHLLSMLEEVAPEGVTRPSLAVLTPGPGNSAYFEHSFLARLMGVELVEGQDLIVAQDRLQMRTTEGLERVDVLYRRIDDDFLDPDVFRPDSLLGVPGLMDLYRRGRLTLVNAPGTGVADDKVVYAYVPDMIRYYLGEDAIIPNVPTYLCWRDEDRRSRACATRASFRPRFISSGRAW